MHCDDNGDEVADGDTAGACVTDADDGSGRNHDDNGDGHVDGDAEDYDEDGDGDDDGSGNYDDCDNVGYGADDDGVCDFVPMVIW